MDGGDEVSIASLLPFGSSGLRFLDPQFVEVSETTTSDHKDYSYDVTYSLEQYSMLSQVMHVGQLLQLKTDR